MTYMAQAGIDSLAAVELRNSIASKFAVTLPATLIFDYPTLSGMAAFVFEALGGQRSTRIPLQVSALHCCFLHFLIDSQIVSCSFSAACLEILPVQYLLFGTVC